MVGKYTQLHDAYLSVVEALKHGGISCRAKVEIDLDRFRRTDMRRIWIRQLHNVDGILVPGGFGNRGTEGMILAAQYARVHKIPYLGICLGMQMAIVEFARHVLGYEDANSIELTSGNKASGNCINAGSGRYRRYWRNLKTWKLSMYSCRRFQIL